MYPHPIRCYLPLAKSALRLLPTYTHFVVALIGHSKYKYKFSISDSDNAEMAIMSNM